MSEEISWNPRLNFVITGSASDENRSLKELTVLSEEHDPYRQDTPAHRRNGWWLKKAVDQFLGPDRKIHLRGLHYLISSAGDSFRLFLHTGGRAVRFYILRTRVVQ